MNPFEIVRDNNEFDQQIINEKIIEIWVENRGRKSDTYLQGWAITIDELKEHLKTIKRNKGCNGSIKSYNGTSENEMDEPKETQYILHLQGNHKYFLQTYLADHGVSSENIKIKG
jgi:translation initiation factor 1 (eIF-1/SUI1)